MRVGGELADLGGRATHFQMAPPTGSEDSSKTYFLQLPVKRAEVAPLATWQLAKEPLSPRQADFPPLLPRTLSGPATGLSGCSLATGARPQVPASGGKGPSLVQVVVVRHEHQDAYSALAPCWVRGWWAGVAAQMTEPAHCSAEG